MAAHKPSRNLRFSLRALLVGVTFIVFLFGLKADQAWRQRNIVAALRNEGATVRYRYQYDPFDPHEKMSSDPDAKPPWLARFIGIDFCSSVVRVSAKGSNDPAEVARLSGRLKKLRSVGIQDCDLKDDDILPLKRLKNLRGLYLRGTSITDKSVRILSAFHGLHVLNVTNTSIAAEGGTALESNLPHCRVHYGKFLGGGMF